MVYRQRPTRSATTPGPLRFPPDELARIVEAQPVRCSHCDPFRFFTAAGAPVHRCNRSAPPRRPVTSSAAVCTLNMEGLYKWRSNSRRHAGPNSSPTASPGPPLRRRHGAPALRLSSSASRPIRIETPRAAPITERSSATAPRKSQPAASPGFDHGAAVEPQTHDVLRTRHAARRSVAYLLPRQISGLYPFRIQAFKPLSTLMT